MKRIVVFVALLCLAALLFPVSASELAEAKKLVDSNASCSSLSDGQLELIGEYLMEQMHPGEAHELMHRMMGLTEGSPEEESFHISMARNMHCGEGSGMGMMGGSGMMGTGGVGGGMMDGWGSMMGGYGTWGIFSIIFWVLTIAALILIIAWLYKALRGSGAGSGDPLAILKTRYAKGEISKKEYGEMRKEIEK